MLPPNYSLIVSSISFIIPITLTAYNHQWLAYSASLSILMTSLLFHSTKHPTYLIIDQATCYYIVAVYLYYAARYGVLYIGIPITSYSFLLYHYGHYTKSLAWSPNIQEANMWHSTIHLAVSLSAAYGSYAIGDLSPSINHL
jgi:hypothetical protein